ncbi:MAG: hypothetical protein A2W35_19690 [Chloroflexi bacterium RBG_16_57_11]|nr:MAG: hypothetical protein A2W35_19690 [Chloroflexi bacterium RBG_16_57_11]
MSELVVLTFDDTEQAGAALEALKKARSEGYLKIDDAAVIVKDESGKVDIKNQLDTGTKWGAVGGGLIGLMLASIFFPLAGLAIGAIGGALVGKSLNLGVDKKFVKDVTETLKPGMSALFVIGSGNPDVVIASLRPFQGTIYQTTLPTEAVEELHAALKKKE